MTQALPEQRTPRTAGAPSLPAPLDCTLVADVARAQAPPRATLSAQAEDACTRSRRGLEALLDAGVPIYGSTTGFGPHVRYAADDDAQAQGSSLVAHLASGTGALLPPGTVRALMYVRANTVARGRSGVRAETVEAYLRLLASGLVPAVPEIGSVGASGDLIPLAHVARALTGQGEVLADGPHAHLIGEVRPAAAALAEVGLAPYALDARDALGLVNGTAYSTTLAAIAVDRAQRLLQRCAELVGWTYASLGARSQALDPRLHTVRSQPGQVRAAALVDRWATRTAAEPGENPERSLQEVYSLRCAPQVLGPAFDLCDTAARMVDDELAGVSDNPVVVEDPTADQGWVALHGGNFHAAAVGTAADLVTGALTQAGVLAERLVDDFATPAVSRGPLLLATRPGAQAGLAGAQLTASAVLAEMRHACAWASTMSVPTNAGNQDIVPMAPLAARTALAQGDRLADVLAVLTLSLVQYQHLVGKGLADGRPATAPGWVPPEVRGFDEDRETRSQLSRLKAALLADDESEVAP